MIDLISVEFMKLKRQKIVYLFIIIAIIAALPVITGLRESRIIKWETVYFNSFLTFNLMFGRVIFSLFSAEIFSKEYSNKTINNMLTTPIKRIKFYFAKLIVIFLVTLCTYLLSFLIILIFSLCSKHEPLSGAVMLTIIKMYIITVLFEIGLIPIVTFLGIFSKNIISSVALGIIAVFISLLVVSSKYSAFFPWCVPILLGMKYCGRQNYSLSTFNSLYGFISLGSVFIIGLVLSIGYYKKSDVHSGS